MSHNTWYLHNSILQKACNIFPRYKTQTFFFCEYKTQTFACGVLEHVYNAHTQDQMCIHIHRACVIIYMCRYTIKVLEALPMHKRDTDNLLHLFDK